MSIGRNNGLEAEILSGLREGGQVVVYPGDKVTDGTPAEQIQVKQK